MVIMLCQVVLYIFGCRVCGDCFVVGFQCFMLCVLGFFRYSICVKSYSCIYVIMLSQEFVQRSCIQMSYINSLYFHDPLLYIISSDFIMFRFFCLIIIIFIGCILVREVLYQFIQVIAILSFHNFEFISQSQYFKRIFYFLEFQQKEKSR